MSPPCPGYAGLEAYPGASELQTESDKHICRIRLNVADARCYVLAGLCLRQSRRTVIEFDQTGFGNKAEQN